MISAEGRRRMGEGAKELWRDPAHREKMSAKAREQTPARKKNLDNLNADPVLLAKRFRNKRGFDVPPELAEDYRFLKKKLGTAIEAGRVLGLIK